MLKRKVDDASFSPNKKHKINDSEIQSNPFKIKDILITIFKHLFKINPALFGTAIVVCKEWRSALHSKFLWHSLKYYALNTAGDSISSDMFIFFLSSAVTRDLEVKQSKILDLLQTIRHQRLDKIVKLCGVPENSVHARNFKTKLCAEARAQKLEDCADKMADVPGNILINLFITAQLPPQLFVRVIDICNRMGYYNSFIDAHYIFGAFREVLKGRNTVMDEAAQYERLDYDEEGAGYLTRMTRLTSHIVDFLKKSSVLLCKVETFDSVIPQDESCRYAWINFLPNDRFLLCFVSFSEDVLYQQFVFVVKGKTTTGEIELAEHFSKMYDIPTENNDEFTTTMNRAWQELLELSDEQVKQISEFYDAEEWYCALLQSFTNDSNEFAADTFIRVAKHLKIRNGVPGQTVTITIDVDELPVEDDV
jgi:hypothetical protein